MNVILSGNAELDSKMGGGIPVGSLTLIEGNSGSGKSVLTQQLISGALDGGLKVALFTNEDSVPGFVRQMNSIDLDILDFLLIGRLRVYPIEIAHLQSKAPQLLMHYIQHRPEDLIIVDSLTSGVRTADQKDILKFFENAKRLCTSGKSIIVTIHSDVMPNDLLGPLRSTCDAHFILNAEQDGQQIVKTLQVGKVRGAANATGAIVGFDVEPGWGLRVVPISKARG